MYPICPIDHIMHLSVFLFHVLGKNWNLCLSLHLLTHSLHYHPMGRTIQI
jgi:hypothetical protein